MIEIRGNLFEQECDAICITTNGVVNGDGKLIMGAGVALEAKKRWPKLPYIWGDMVSENGNKPIIINKEHLNSPYHVISFPTKHHWREVSDIILIRESCDHLIHIVDFEKLEKIVLPRPGCGHGGLAWHFVKPEIKRFLDNRFYIITNDWV